MVKDPDCKNHNWKAIELESKIDERVRKLLNSPKIVEEIKDSRKPKEPVPTKNIEIEKRIREIDRQISKLMELYQRDDIPTEVLDENINKLYNEKTTLQTSLEPVPVDDTLPFDLVQELIADAAQIWDFADEAQKRRILQSFIHRIILTEDDIKIEWNF